MVQQEEKINVLITLFAFLPLVDQAIEWLSWNIGITLLFLRMIELLSWLITNGLEIVISNRLLSWKISYIYCAFLVVTVRLCEEATDLTSRMNFIKLKATDSFFFSLFVIRTQICRFAPDLARAFFLYLLSFWLWFSWLSCMKLSF